MNYIPATIEMADTIYQVLQTTIKSIYPDYYPQEVVEFFCRHHSKEHILEGISSGNMGVLKIADEIVGTGCFNKNPHSRIICITDLPKAGIRIIYSEMFRNRNYEEL